MPQRRAGHPRPTAGDTGTLGLATKPLFTWKEFGSFKTTATKDFQSNTVSQSRGPKTLHKAASTRSEMLNGEESEIKLKKRRRESRSKDGRNPTFPQGSAASRKDSEHAQLLTLSLEKFHERFKLCVDEDHHFQGVELRSWGLNPIKRRSCKKGDCFPE